MFMDNFFRKINYWTNCACYFLLSVRLARPVQVSRAFCLVQRDIAATCYFAATFFLAAATCFRTSAHRTLTGQRATATQAGKRKKGDVTNCFHKSFPKK